MTLTALLCALFFGGFLGLRRHGQALAFLGLGAGVQALTYLLPVPGAAEVSFARFALVSLSSAAGYAAWRLSRDRMVDGMLGRQRLGIFAGVAANLGLAILILWQTGTLSATD